MGITLKPRHFLVPSIRLRAARARLRGPEKRLVRRRSPLEPPERKAKARRAFMSFSSSLVVHLEKTRSTIASRYALWSDGSCRARIGRVR